MTRRENDVIVDHMYVPAEIAETITKDFYKHALPGWGFMIDPIEKDE